MSIRKRGKSWQVRVHPFPDQTYPSKAAAEKAERHLKERKALGDLWMDRPASLGEALTRHLERKRQGGKRGPLRVSSLKFVEQNLRAWQPLRDVTLTALRRAMVEDHIRARVAKAPTSARNELQELKAVLREEQARGQRVDPGIFTIELGRKPQRVGRALTVQELQLVASKMPERVRRMVLVCGTVGLRFQEAAKLTDDMLDLDNGRLTIPEWLNKSRRDKTIDLSVTEVRWLREQLLIRPAGTNVVFPTERGGVYAYTGFRSVWDKALLDAGFARKVRLEDGRERIQADIRFHDLRHTATSLMCAAGMRPEHVAARRGDSDGGALVFKRYRHLYPSEVSEAVKVIDGLFGSGLGDVREQH